MSEKITTEEKYWPNGNLRSRFNHKNEKLYGLWELWYENGDLQSRGNYKNGNIHGLFESWLKNGTIFSRQYYFNDKEVTEFEFDVLETCGEFENE